MELYEQVFAVLRNALWGEALCALPDGQAWERICEELSAQSVQTLAADVIAAAAPAALHQTNRVKAVRAVTYWHRVMRLQAQIDALLRDQGIGYAVIKGAAACVAYPKPEYRVMGDIDLVVAPEDHDRALRVLLDHGFAQLDGETVRHSNLVRDGIQVELHHHFSSFSDARAAAALNAQIGQGIAAAQKETLEGYAFSMLPPLENGLVLIAHIDHHMEHGLGLRQIIDWMLFVDRQLDDVWWQREFGECVSRLGLARETIAVTRMCQMYLGLREEGISWCAGADETLCRDLMRWIMDGGNFGRKRSEESFGAVRVFNEIPKLRHLSQHLRDYGQINWKAAEKHPILRPFAGFYQIARYVKLGLKRKEPIRQLVRDLRESRRESALFDRLELARRRKNGYRTGKGEQQ